jgi:hypothetical protein
MNRLPVAGHDLNDLNGAQRWNVWNGLQFVVQNVFRELTQRHPSGYFLQQTGAKKFHYSGGCQSFSKLRLA